VIFGADTAKLIGSEVKQFGGTNAIVLYGGGSAVRSGVLDMVTKSLSDEGISYFLIGGVQPNPLAEFAQKVVDDHKDEGVDFVIGVGGGSVLDTAKAVAHGLKSPETPLWDYHIRKATVKASLPIGVVVTIAAAGSETSDSAVLTSKAAGMKRGLNVPFNRPAFAIMDPTLTYSLPAYQTACGITDILLHALDRYFAPDADNAVTDELSEGLMRVVIRYGKTAMERPDDYKARSELMWAGSAAHNGLTGLGQTMDFAVHQLGAQLSAKYDTAHGASLSATWPAWARYVYRKDVPRFARYAKEVWGVAEDDDEAAAVAGIKATEEFFRSLGMPVTMTEAEGDRVAKDIDELADMCTYRRTRTVGSFVVLGFDEIKEIYRLAL